MRATAIFAGSLFWVGPPKIDPKGSYHSRQAPPNGQNTGYYKNPEADRLMEAAEREMDEGKRLALYRQVHRVLAADPGITTAGAPTLSDSVKSRIVLTLGLRVLR